MDYKSFMEALKGNQHKIDKNKNGKVDAHDFKLLRKEESELNEGTADELGDSIDNAKSTEHAKSIIAKAPTKHLQYLHHWNMGLSGARTHKDMPHIKAELTSRKAVLSNAESSKRFDEQVDLDEATVKTQKYDGGKVMTVHHGASHSYPLHPEHQEAIRNLKHGEKTSFKDETGAKVNVHRDVQDVHFTSNKTSTKTTVPHSNFSEETELDEIRRMKTKLNSLDVVSNMSVARQKLSDLMKSGKAKGALIANKRRTLNMGEEVETIEELSKSTLGSYAKKASRDAVITRKIGADFERKADAARSPGMQAANTELSSRYKQKSFKRRDGLEKAVDRLTKEEVEQIDEANHREFASQGLMHPDMAKHMKTGQEMDFYHSKTGDKISGVVKHNTNGEVHIKANKDGKLGAGEVHKFKVSSNLKEFKTLSYSDFISNLLEYTPGPGGVTQVKGRSYGASYVDPEGEDDYDDKKPVKVTPEKRGRGRPAGAQSGARKNLGNSKLHTK